LPVIPVLPAATISTHLVDLLDLYCHSGLLQHLHAFITFEDDLAVELSHLEVYLGLFIRLLLLDVRNQLLDSLQLVRDLDSLGEKGYGLPRIEQFLPEIEDLVSDSL